jgi:DNA-binding transcriptional MerR regulator
MQPRRIARRIFIYGLFGVTLLLLVGVFVYRQNVQDWIRLRGYEPTPDIAKLADDITMLSSSRRLFYVQNPLLADKTTFNNFCTQNNEYTIVLGCYINGQGIYLLDVTDERLAGVEQVTAAHELLHAAYERLSDKDRKWVDDILTSTYAGVTNERLRKTVEQYRKQDPSIVPNELHSILGSELRTLPQELEDYYKRYFVNRGQIVSFSEQYEQAFIERRNAIRDYDSQLTSLKTQIDDGQARLFAEEDSLGAQRTNMNTLRNSGQIDAYNALVPVYNQKVNAYNAGVEELETLVARYNDIVQKRNDIATEEAELAKALDSREVVPTQQ